MKYFQFLFCYLLMIPGVFSQKNAAESVPLKLDWQLHTNHYQNRNEALSSLTLTNTGKKTFAAAGWTIYFNNILDVDDSRTTGNAHIAHVNGDLYSLKPAPGFRELNPGESVRISYVTSGQLRNYSSAPNGVYLVWDADPDKGIPVADFHLIPIQDTTIAWVTPAVVFERNRSIRELPAGQAPGILPTPVFWQMKDGGFLLQGSVQLTADPLFASEAAMLRKALESRKDLQWITAKKGETVRQVVFQQGAMANEAYRLLISDEKIEVTASSPAGAFYAVQSVLSLIQPNNLILAAEVRDEPRFGFRSLSFDVGRNFRSKQEVLKVLDLMAMYKLNVLHFHITEDEGWRLEIPGLPELTDVGAKRGHTADGKTMLQPAFGSGPIAGKTAGTGFYTKNDFIDILRYATERHIRVIPEIEAPGHARAAIKAMDARYDKWMQSGNKAEAEKYLLRDINDRSVYLSAQLWKDNVLCVALPSVYTFLEKVTDELISMYREAGAPLETVHMGGDEVPAGTWEKSPFCQQLIARDPALENTNDLWYYFYGKLNDMVQRKNLYMSGWEEMAMRKTMRDGNPVMIPNPGFAGNNMQVHVWNNALGWGAEDLPYRLANAGFKVVLSPVSNNYFDLAYYKHPDEPGYAWGGYVDTDKPFYFVPFDYYKTSVENPNGDRVSSDIFIGKDRLTDYGRSNIVGLEGLIWAENMPTDADMEYLLAPKILAFAERAWAPDPAWALEKDPAESKRLYDIAWSAFVHQVGKKELPRLDNAFGGFRYRIPPPGAMVENGQVLLNVQFPGLTIRYTTDGTEPDNNSRIYTAPIREKGRIRARAFAGNGRGSRTVEVAR